MWSKGGDGGGGGGGGGGAGKDGSKGGEAFSVDKLQESAAFNIGGGGASAWD